MKNFVKIKAVQRIAGIIALAAVIGFSFASCKDSGSGSNPSTTTPTFVVESTAGELRITGIPAAYNDKYILGMDTDDKFYALAGANFTNAVLNLVKITGGSATLKVWRFDETKGLLNYNGNDQNVEFALCIFNNATITSTTNIEANAKAVALEEVDFINGIATLTTASWIDTP